MDRYRLKISPTLESASVNLPQSFREVYFLHARTVTESIFANFLQVFREMNKGHL